MSTSRDNRQPVRNKGVGYFEAEACLMIWGLVKRVLNHLQMACQICAEGFVNREGFSVLLTKRLWHTNNKAQIKEKWRTMKLICSLDVFIISNKACSALNLFAFLFTLERFKDCLRIHCLAPFSGWLPFNYENRFIFSNN